MTDLHCHACRRRLGKRARCALINGTAVLCTTCAEDHATHQKIFFNCKLKHRPVAHSGGGLVSRGRAAQIIQEDK